MIEILEGDALERLRELADESVQCCVTSPPFWGLRDYGTARWAGGDDSCDHIAPAGVSGGQRADRTFTLGEIYKDACGKCGAKRVDSQLGLEATPEEYVANMVDVFREVRRVLRKDGTLWLNLGDSYVGGGGFCATAPSTETSKSGKYGTSGAAMKSVGNVPGLKPKDLCGIPWRVAFALQADGWWLRSDIIWAKPNPMPESVTDRPTKSHEYLFLLTKSANYFYDAEAIKEPNIGGFNDFPSHARIGNGTGRVRYDANGQGAVPSGHVGINANGRNKRSVWTVATAPYPEAHFATYPPDLIKPCIMAGTSAKGCCAKCGAPWERIVESVSNPRRTEGRFPSDFRSNVNGLHAQGSGSGTGALTPTTTTLGWQPTCGCKVESGNGKAEISTFNFQLSTVPCTVLDPFAGSGTTGAVALELGRRAVLIELNPKYVELIEQRCDVTMGLQLA